MSEYATSEIAELSAAAAGLAAMVRTRARRAYRDADELRRLAAQLAAVAAALEQRVAESESREGHTVP